MSELENLSELFGTAAEDDGGSDFDAIFGDNAADEPLPMPEEVTASDPAEAAPTQEAEPEPEETDAPAEEQTEPKEESKPKEEAKAAANPKSRKAKTQEKEAEPDLFSAFNDQEDTPPAPEPQTSVATAAAGQVSLFDKPALFSYGSAKEPIEDASMTFEELRIKKSEDFPELESGKTVSWRVRYGAVTKSITDPKESTIAKSKEEIERSKVFLDGLKKAKNDKDRNPDCLVSPIVTAKSKGIAAYAGVFPTVEAARASDKVICILPARDGRIYEMRKNEMGEFIAPKNKVADFAEVRAGFSPALPLIPRELMEQIITFFRCLMSGRTEYEAMVFLYWDRQEEEFVVYVPKQTASKASIHADLTDNTLPEDRYLHYADIHSHNSMAAKFSTTDDADERATRLYIVIGRLDRFYPDISARVSCGGTYLPIDTNLVVESVGEEFPTKWLDQVERVGAGRTERNVFTGGPLFDMWPRMENLER